MKTSEKMKISMEESMYIWHGREPPTDNFQPSSEVVAAGVHPMWSVCEQESTTIAYESSNTINLSNLS